MHDIYGKISLLFFMSHWLHGASFYIQSHAFTELRAIWVGWSCTVVLVSSHYCLLKIDIFPPAAKAQFVKWPIEQIAFLTPLLTCVGMSLEYSIIVPSEGIKTFIYVIAWICYIIHVLFAIRLYEISTPTLQAERPDIAGQPWWPSEWWLPTAFQHALYLIAPPKHCEPGQTCLQQEMKIAKKAGQSTVSGKKARESLPPLFAYKIFRGGAQVMIAVWVVIVVGRIIEQLHGERHFFRQEGRAERWPSHMQPWMPPWTRDHSRNEWCHTGGCDRRLSSDQTQVGASVKVVAQKLSSLLTAVSDTLDHELAESSKDTHTPSPLHKARVQWPQRVQPSVLACNGESSVAAVTKDAKIGVMMSLQQKTQQQLHVENTTAFSVVTSAVKFSLQGFENEIVDILGVSWDSTGLILTTANGFVAECAGNVPAAGDVWHCRRVGIPLPSGGSKLKWAAVARVASCSRLRAAVVFEGDEVVTIYEQSPGISDAWLPAGEVRLPHHAGNLVSLSLADGAEELLISSKDGGVMRWPLGGAVPVVAASPRATLAASDLMWRGTCGLGVGRFAHLAWRTNRGKVLSHAPELFISSRRA
jgi:hypothetical protein